MDPRSRVRVTPSTFILPKMDPITCVPVTRPETETEGTTAFPQVPWGPPRSEGRTGGNALSVKVIGRVKVSMLS